MQGVWSQDSVAYGSRLNTWTRHNFRFSCDSFYVELATRSKINFYDDTCFNGGKWKEYAKGIYAVSGDTLLLGGTFTHENYRQKLTGCYRIGRYDKSFLIRHKSADTLVLESLDDRLEMVLGLKEKITCIQKPL